LTIDNGNDKNNIDLCGVAYSECLTAGAFAGNETKTGENDLLKYVKTESGAV
jgi:hypothetical protein